MGRFQVIPDAVAVAGDRLVTVVSVDPDGTVTVRDLANGRVHTTSAHELSARPALITSRTANGPIIAGATDAQWALAQRRKEAIASIDDAGNAADQVTRVAQELGVSRRTVFRWMAAYRQTPLTSALLPRPRGTPRVHTASTIDWTS